LGGGGGYRLLALFGSCQCHYGLNHGFAGLLFFPLPYPSAHFQPQFGGDGVGLVAPEHYAPAGSPGFAHAVEAVCANDPPPVNNMRAMRMCLRFRGSLCAAARLRWSWHVCFRAMRRRLAVRASSMAPAPVHTRRPLPPSPTTAHHTQCHPHPR
jgi:hypothetical protein